MPPSIPLTTSVIIPVRNGGDHFRKSLLSVSSCSPPPDEVIVVADGDSDGSWRAAREFTDQVFRLPVSHGPAGARNLGARKARGDILYFVDADVTIPPDAITKIRKVFQDKPDHAAVIGSYDDEPFQENFLSQYKNLFHHYVHQNAREEASTFWAACGAIRRETLFQVGGFDERFKKASIEDIDLGYRLRKFGHRVWLLKDLQVKHFKRWGVFSLIRADFFYRALPWTDLILRESGFINDLNLKIKDRFSVIWVFLILCVSVGAASAPWLWLPAVLMGLILMGINWDLYRFFKDKRGLSFALKAIPMHWLYFLYSGLAFGLGFTRYHVKRLLTRPGGR
jgi:glycosyltransferase involved in cell wall biosynthesis